MTPVSRAISLLVAGMAIGAGSTVVLLAAAVFIGGGPAFALVTLACTGSVHVSGGWPRAARDVVLAVVLATLAVAVHLNAGSHQQARGR